MENLTVPFLWFCLGDPDIIYFKLVTFVSVNSELTFVVFF